MGQGAVWEHFKNQEMVLQTFQQTRDVAISGAGAKFQCHLVQKDELPGAPKPQKCVPQTWIFLPLAYPPSCLPSKY